MMSKVYILFLSALVFATAISVQAAETASSNHVVKVVNGISWMSALPKLYPNGCVDRDGHYAPEKCMFETDANGKPIVVDGYFQVDLAESHAEQACRALGARLPTQWEFHKLVRSYKGMYR